MQVSGDSIHQLKNVGRFPEQRHRKMYIRQSYHRIAFALWR